MAVQKFCNANFVNSSISRFHSLLSSSYIISPSEQKELQPTAIPSTCIYQYQQGSSIQWMTTKHFSGQWEGKHMQMPKGKRKVSIIELIVSEYDKMRH